MSRRNRLTFRERRELGLTVVNIMPIYRRMRESGELDAMSASEAAVVVADELQGTYPKAYEAAGVDWDAILAFIERIIELLLKLFG